jgi:hypothetical protein
VAPLTDVEEEDASIRAVEEETACDVPTKQPMRQLVTPSAVVVADEREE